MEIHRSGGSRHRLGSRGNRTSAAWPGSQRSREVLSKRVIHTLSYNAYWISASRERISEHHTLLPAHLHIGRTPTQSVISKIYLDDMSVHHRHTVRVGRNSILPPVALHPRPPSAPIVEVFQSLPLGRRNIQGTSIQSHRFTVPCGFVEFKLLRWQASLFALQARREPCASGIEPLSLRGVE